MDWSDSKARYLLAEEVGIDRYNELFREYLKSCEVATVNGHVIHHYATRSGPMFTVVGTGIGYATLDEAKTHAALLPPKT